MSVKREIEHPTVITIYDSDGKSSEYHLQRYTGQDYDAYLWGLTVVIVEDTNEVFLVPYDGNYRLMIEELIRYLEDTETPWYKTHTVHKYTWCDFTNPKYEHTTTNRY